MPPRRSPRSTSARTGRCPEHAFSWWHATSPAGRGCGSTWARSRSRPCARAAAGASGSRVRIPSGTPRLYRLTARARRVRVRIPFRLLAAPAKKPAPAQVSTPAPAPPPPPPSPPPVKLVTAGDIACAPPGTQTATECHQGATAARVAALAPDAVLALGDNQYEHGELANFNQVFDASWGQFKSKIHPIPGNHEYTDPADPTHQTAPGYYGYFGAAAGDPAQGYYTFSTGSWQVFVLNSGDLQNTVDCAPVSCAPGSAQATWLDAQLDQLPADKCVIGAIHHPHHGSFTTRAHPTEEAALYSALYDHGAELLLSGHDHE